MSQKAAMVGEMVAKRGITAGVKQIAFDRGVLPYKKRVASLANAARAAGLEF